MPGKPSFCIPSVLYRGSNFPLDVIFSWTPGSFETRASALLRMRGGGKIMGTVGLFHDSLYPRRVISPNPAATTSVADAIKVGTVKVPVMSAT